MCICCKPFRRISAQNADTHLLKAHSPLSCELWDLFPPSQSSQAPPGAAQSLWYQHQAGAADSHCVLQTHVCWWHVLLTATHTAVPVLCLSLSLSLSIRIYFLCLSAWVCVSLSPCAIFPSLSLIPSISEVFSHVLSIMCPGPIERNLIPAIFVSRATSWPPGRVGESEKSVFLVKVGGGSFCEPVICQWLGGEELKKCCCCFTIGEGFSLCLPRWPSWKTNKCDGCCFFRRRLSANVSSPAAAGESP